MGHEPRTTSLLPEARSAQHIPLQREPEAQKINNVKRKEQQ